MARLSSEKFAQVARFLPTPSPLPSPPSRLGLQRSGAARPWPKATSLRGTGG
jgi:hypothetical protein